ncbi:MAG: hypothetical protein IJA14_04245, partial [Alphaproteobacteria bacterium]|nr:hypothetical protein [Alphaproteobacteria bacterium]
NRPWEPKFTRSGQSSAQREAEYQEAKKTFEIKTSGQYNFGIVNYSGRTYHMETNGSSTFLSTTDRGGWEITPFNGYDSTTTFTPTSEMERLAMRSFNFEETPLIWHFSRENINGYWYNRAYTDSAHDIMVPENEVHNIAAPKWYTEMRKLRQQEQRARVEQTKKEELIKQAVEGYMRESQYSLWASTQHANNWSFNPASAPEVSFARECAQTTLEYYDRGLEIAESANVARLYEYAVAFVVPGGIDNLWSFAYEALSPFEFLSNVGRDVAVTAATGGAIGFVSKVAKTTLRTARQAQIVSRAENASSRASAVAGRTVRIYGQGRFWERLISSDTMDATVRKFRDLADKYTSRTYKKTRFDRDGFAYQFDPAHQNMKVHLHKYRKVGSDKFQLIAEVDPETGVVTRIISNGKIEQW